MIRVASEHRTTNRSSSRTRTWRFFSRREITQSFWGLLRLSRRRGLLVTTAPSFGKKRLLNASTHFVSSISFCLALDEANFEIFIPRFAHFDFLVLSYCRSFSACGVLQPRTQKEKMFFFPPKVERRKNERIEIIRKTVLSVLSQRLYLPEP